jgi:hypothetical protein
VVLGVLKEVTDTLECRDKPLTVVGDYCGFVPRCGLQPKLNFFAALEKDCVKRFLLVGLEGGQTCATSLLGL